MAYWKFDLTQRQHYETYLVRYWQSVYDKRKKYEIYILNLHKKGDAISKGEARLKACKLEQADIPSVEGRPCQAAGERPEHATAPAAKKPPTAEDRLQAAPARRHRRPSRRPRRRRRAPAPVPDGTAGELDDHDRPGSEHRHPGELQHQHHDHAGIHHDHAGIRDDPGDLNGGPVAFGGVVPSGPDRAAPAPSEL